MSAELEVPAALEGERLDRCVSLLFAMTRRDASDLVASGGVAVDGAVVDRRSRRLRTGERLSVEVPPEVAPPAPLANADVPFRVVYEDGDLLVIDKPPGVVVHPGAGHRNDTLVSGLLARYPDIVAGGGDPDRPGIVHRLDKDTSGLLVVARNEQARATLQADLAERKVGRTYLTLAKGRVEAESGVIDAPIGRSQRDPTRMAVRDSGRAARTHYVVLNRFNEPSLVSYLEVHLETGRTHQIRVHLRAIGHPVVGDHRYGGTLPALGLARPFLHAFRLELTHPRTGETLLLEAPLAPDLVEALARCH